MAGGGNGRWDMAVGTGRPHTAGEDTYFSFSWATVSPRQPSAPDILTDYWGEKHAAVNGAGGERPAQICFLLLCSVLLRDTDHRGRNTFFSLSSGFSAHQDYFLTLVFEISGKKGCLWSYLSIMLLFL